VQRSNELYDEQLNGCIGLQIVRLACLPSFKYHPARSAIMFVVACLNV
jgi:hypothetical protein